MASSEERALREALLRQEGRQEAFEAALDRLAEVIRAEPGFSRRRPGLEAAREVVALLQKEDERTARVARGPGKRG